MINSLLLRDNNKTERGRKSRRITNPAEPGLRKYSR